MPYEQPLITVRNFWGRKFALISTFVVIATGVAVVFFDKTDHTKFMQFGQPVNDTTTHDIPPALPSNSHKGEPPALHFYLTDEIETIPGVSISPHGSTQ